MVWINLVFNFDGGSTSDKSVKPRVPVSRTQSPGLSQGHVQMIGGARAHGKW
jgi:hypothetical protein